jgi:cytoskeleton protein RodZ
MASVGEILRRERERQGLPLADIAQQTRIKKQYLEAVERDDFESLPGRFFARSFTTQYAERLGVNNAELAAALDRQVATAQPPPVTGKEVVSGTGWAYQEYSVDPMPEGSASAINARKMTASIVMLVAVVIACGAIFWLWQRSQLSSTSASTGLSEGSRTAQDVAPPAVQPAPVAEPPAALVTPETQTAAPTPAPTSAPTPTPAPSPTPAPAEATPQVPASGKISLAIVAKEDTWLRITVDGKVILAAVLARGEQRVAAASENAKVLLGNAGGVDIRFNGSDIGTIGPRGQVRTVDFTPDRFTVIEPAPRKAPTEGANPQPLAGLNDAPR